MIHCEPVSISLMELTPCPQLNLEQVVAQVFTNHYDTITLYGHVAVALWIAPWCSDQGSTGSNPTAVSMSLCPWARHFTQIAPVGIAHSIEYASRFG